jgi:hypothetical protein
MALAGVLAYPVVSGGTCPELKAEKINSVELRSSFLMRVFA